MIVFNTTYHIDDAIHDEVIAYLKREFIPKAIESKLLRDPHLFYIHPQYEEAGKSYSLQFRAKDLEALELWMEQFGGAIQEELTNRFGNKACGFMTLLQEEEL